MIVKLTCSDCGETVDREVDYTPVLKWDFLAVCPACGGGNWDAKNAPTDLNERIDAAIAAKNADLPFRCGDEDEHDERKLWQSEDHDPEAWRG